MKRLLAPALALTVAACQRPAAPPAVCPLPATSSGASADADAPAAALVTRLREFERNLPNARLQGLVASGFITHAASVTTAYEVPANTCVSLVALGTGGIRDLDAHLFDPTGDLLVEDLETDAHPTVQLCASSPRRVYHVLDAYEGSGAYVLAALLTDRAGLATVARVLGGHPGVAAGEGGARSEVERRLNELRDGIARRGFLPVGEPTRTDFPAAGAVRVPLIVTPDRCYTVAAVAGGNLRDVDLRLYDPQGELAARDERPSVDATLQLCPPAPGTYAVEVRARGGDGMAVLQSFAADAAALGGSNALWLGERVAWGAQAMALEDVVPAVTRDLAALGYTPTRDAQGNGAVQSLGAGESREITVRAEASKCTAIAAIAGRGVSGVSVEVFDARGDLLARGRRQGAATVSVVCPTSAEELRVAIAAQSGTGSVMLRTLQASAVPAWAEGVDRVAVSDAMADAWTRAPGRWRVEGAPEKLRVGAGARRTREVSRAAGECVRYTASAGRGLPWLSLTLRDERGDRVQSATGEGSAVVVRCGASAERLQVELRSDPVNAAEVDALLTRSTRHENGSAP